MVDPEKAAEELEDGKHKSVNGIQVGCISQPERASRYQNTKP